MTENAVHLMSEVLASGRRGSTFRLALIHFTEMADEERRSELATIRLLTTLNAGEKQQVLTLLGKYSALNFENRRGLAAQLREDFRQDVLAEQRKGMDLGRTHTRSGATLSRAYLGEQWRRGRRWIGSYFSSGTR